ncbi:MAG: GNAT family N-acetyltransferase [Oscillospiraceae bacterium]|nr:GNAT family N-acetyltransferase [Oscillospiraceae bacterium]
MYTDTNPDLYISITSVMDRGTALVLENCEDGIFIKDTVSGLYMLACRRTDTAKQWLVKHEGDYGVVVTFDSHAADFVKSRYGLCNTLECYQAVYAHTTAPQIKADLDVRNATKEDFDFVAAVYNKVSPEELKEIINRNQLFIATKDSRIIGFAGQHLEGSLGILEVMPEYRGNGYGKYLEVFMIDHMLKKGQKPFCQVETFNKISLELQKKLGYNITTEKVYFIY